MIVKNYHTHTVRCGHSRGTEREYIENAIEAGIKVLGFADHAPYPFPNGYKSSYRMALGKTEDYVNTLLKLKEEYKDKLDILIGFEAEYYPELFDAFLKHINQFPIDYLILGQHAVNNEYDGVPSGRTNACEELLVQYANQVIAGINTGKFSYICHPEMCVCPDEEIYRRELKRIYLEAKRLDIPLEFNLLGYYTNRHYPNEISLETAAEVGNTLILGVDAHEPERFMQLDVVERAERLIEKYGISITDEIKLGLL